MNDTICAVSTAPGIGAISIIRISGSNAIKIVNNLFPSKNLEEVKSHTIHYGILQDEKKELDEVLISIMNAPKTFTKEDLVEINIHGSMIIASEIIGVLLKSGCRIAEPGEFTKRAFLNGRITLPEAESVMDLINSKTEASKDIALNNLSGKFNQLVQELKSDIIKIITNLAVNIDYPEYEDELEVTNELLEKSIIKYKDQLTLILKESKTGKIIKEGINTVIIGSPNVGKSSLLNILIKEEKAIVTEIPGTTRDIVEGTVNLEGILLNIIDTAGIRSTEDKVEKLGVKKSLEMAKKADLILLVLNNNKKLTTEELTLLKSLEDKNIIIILNKIDLKTNISLEKIEKYKTVEISIKEEKGIEKIGLAIKEMFNLEKIKTKDITYLSTARQINVIEKILAIIKDIEKAIKDNIPVDMIELDLKKIWLLLGELLGETFDEEVIDEMFKNFCLGK